MNISAGLIDKISAELREPEWAKKERMDAYRRAENLPVPQSRYSKLPGFSINNFVFAEGKGNNVSEMDGDFIQMNNHILKAPSSMGEKTIVMGLGEAVLKHPEMAKRFIFTKPSDSINPDKFEMLSHALFRGGLFVYIGEGVQIPQPLFARFVLSGESSMMFAPVIIVADRGASFKIVEFHSSLENSRSSVDSGIVYLFLEEGAQMEYISIREPGEENYSFTTFRSFLKNNARLNWRNVWFGGRIQKANVVNYMNGQGSQVDEVQVFFMDKKEHLDITTRLLHYQQGTKSRVLVKGALRDRARAVFLGNVRIEKEAQETDSFLSDHVMLLNPGARADSIPGLEIEADQVRASHSASIGQIDEEQVFYLMSRGLDEGEAKKTIVSGFLSPAIDAIPDETVRQRVWQSFDTKW